jgi:predicted metal-binding membrane protein
MNGCRRVPFAQASTRAGARAATNAHDARAAHAGHGRLRGLYVLYAFAALSCAGCAMLTVRASAAMAAMGALPMPGGWTLSTLWVPGCGQTWWAMATSFVGMWSTMMGAMMVPLLAPMLGREEAALARGGIGAARRAGWVAQAAAGYALVWSALGPAIWLSGAAWAALALRGPLLARAAPWATGIALIGAGLFQFSACKARVLACCRAGLAHGSRGAPSAPSASSASASASAGAAWRYGLRAGIDCSVCCAGLTLALVVTGMMDLRTMTGVTIALAAERFVPRGARVARAIGVVLGGAGAWQIARAVGVI